MASVFEAYLKQYQKKTDGKYILNRPDVKAVCQEWPDAAGDLSAILDAFGESEIKVDFVDAIKKDHAAATITEQEATEMIIKLAAAFNHYHERRIKAEDYFSKPGADEKHRAKFEEVKRQEAAAKSALDDLKLFDGILYEEDQGGYLKIYQRTETGLTELKFKRRAA